MPRQIPVEIVGTRFGKFTVTGFPEVKGRGEVVVKCDCGTVKKVALFNLRNGKSKSCGCLISGRPMEFHGKSTHPSFRRTYQIWASMLQRCAFRSSKGHRHYAGRGIKVCERWAKSFVAFLEDMGVCPHHFSIERRDVDGDYQKSNCYWIDLSAQNGNRRDTVWITWREELIPASHALARVGIKNSTFWHHKKHKSDWSPQEVFDWLCQNYRPRKK